jgi:hypothetical protein
MKEKQFSLRSLFFWILLICASAYVLSPYFLILTVPKGYQDTEYACDYRAQGVEIGTAVRLSNAGILGEKPNCYVVIAKSRAGEIRTLYEGPGGFNDPTSKPLFRRVTDGRVVYAIGNAKREIEMRLPDFRDGVFNE